MNSTLVPGAAIPDFDKHITTWLDKARHHHPCDASTEVKIGIRNDHHHIYRTITVCGKGQHFDAVTYFDQSGFLALPVDFARETGLDYVFHHAGW